MPHTIISSVSLHISLAQVLSQSQIENQEGYWSIQAELSINFLCSILPKNISKPTVTRVTLYKSFLTSVTFKYRLYTV